MISSFYGLKPKIKYSDRWDGVHRREDGSGLKEVIYRDRSLTGRLHPKVRPYISTEKIPLSCTLYCQWCPFHILSLDWLTAVNAPSFLKIWINHKTPVLFTAQDASVSWLLSPFTDRNHEFSPPPPQYTWTSESSTLSHTWSLNNPRPFILDFIHWNANIHKQILQINLHTFS